MSVRDLHPLRGEPDFRWRGGDPSRTEALSDMVFAFALTLLVVSTEPPGTFSDLRDQLWGFPGFAAAFIMLLVVWHAHYIFFRRYGLADGWTTALNAALLFLILFFVYPLKYLATMLSRFAESVAIGSPVAPMSLGDAQGALVLLSVAYAAVFAVFVALYAHALRNADRLELDADERKLTRFSFFEQIVHAGIAGAVALTAALAPAAAAPWAGFLYFFIGPVIGMLGAVMLPKHPKVSAPTAEAETTPE
jgi:uncharacterized membrane protein